MATWLFSDAPPTLTLPLKGGGNTECALDFPSPLEGEGRVGGVAASERTAPSP
jgi:hypothetical protein